MAIDTKKSPLVILALDTGDYGLKMSSLLPKT